MYGVREVEGGVGTALELTQLEWDGQKVRQFRGEVLKEARGCFWKWKLCTPGQSFMGNMMPGSPEVQIAEPLDMNS